MPEGPIVASFIQFYTGSKHYLFFYKSFPFFRIFALNKSIVMAGGLLINFIYSDNGCARQLVDD